MSVQPVPKTSETPRQLNESLGNKLYENVRENVAIVMDGFAKVGTPCDEHCSDLAKIQHWQNDVSSQEFARRVSSCMNECKRFQDQFHWL